MGDFPGPDNSRVVDEDFYEYTRRECGGIHIMKKVIPADEDFDSRKFDAFDGLTLRVYIRASDPQAQYKMDIRHPNDGFATIELKDGKAHATVGATPRNQAPQSSSEMDYKEMNIMSMFTFAVRAGKNSASKETLQCLVFNDVIHEIEMPWKGLKFSERLVNCVRVSLHIFHDCGGPFPDPLRMVPYIKAFCRLNQGEEAIYQGKVHGTKPVHVVAPGLVDDLPLDDYPTDGIFEIIAVEMREDYYFFSTNMPKWFMMHLTNPVCGESYPPLFSSNYDVSLLLITTCVESTPIKAQESPKLFYTAIRNRQIMAAPENPPEN